MWRFQVSPSNFINFDFRYWILTKKIIKISYRVQSRADYLCFEMLYVNVGTQILPETVIKGKKTFNINAINSSMCSTSKANSHILNKRNNYAKPERKHLKFNYWVCITIIIIVLKQNAVLSVSNCRLSKLYYTVLRYLP